MCPTSCPNSLTVVSPHMSGLWFTFTLVPLGFYFVLKSTLLEVINHWKKFSARETIARSHLGRRNVHAGTCKRNVCMLVGEVNGARCHLPDLRCDQTPTHVHHMSRQRHTEHSSCTAKEHPQSRLRYAYLDLEFASPELWKSFALSVTLDLNDQHLRIQKHPAPGTDNLCEGLSALLKNPKAMSPASSCSSTPVAHNHFMGENCLREHKRPANVSSTCFSLDTGKCFT